MKLHSMRKPEGDRDETASAGMRDDAPRSDADDYPYDVHMHLGHDTLKQADAPGNIEAGDLHEVRGHFRVHRVEEETGEDGKTKRRIHGHFEKMGMEKVPETKKAKSLREEISDRHAESEAKREGKK